MNTKLVAAAALVLFLGAPGSAHRLDEYLQATIISVEKDHVQAFMRLIPGVAASSVVIASIDSNGDGVISEAEQRAYAERVLGDLLLTVDGNSLRPKLVSVNFPETQEMKEGLGEIRIEFTVDLVHGGPERRIVFENHHQNEISVYLANCLVPRDPNIRILAQNRNERQSFYQLDYTQAGSSSEPASLKGWSAIRGWVVGCVTACSRF